MTIEKIYIDANQLLLDAYELGLQVLESGFQPDFVVGIWRGGAPVGIAIHELLRYSGLDADHIAVRTSHYTGINRTGESVSVHGLEYLVANLHAADRVLLVDDVFDTGLSIQQLINNLQRQCRRGAPLFRIATPYFKPANNRTRLAPDYYLHETADWLVFPHELEGLSEEEILRNKPGLGHIRGRIARCRSSG